MYGIETLSPMKIKKLLFALTLLLASGAYSCKKCSTCTSVDSSGKILASEKYCSMSQSNIDTFEASFRTTYGHTCTCKRE
jgi:hypothetical protein